MQIFKKRKLFVAIRCLMTCVIRAGYSGTKMFFSYVTDKWEGEVFPLDAFY